MSGFQDRLWLVSLLLFVGCSSTPIESVFQAEAGSRKYSRILVRAKGDLEGAIKTALIRGSSTYVLMESEHADKREVDSILTVTTKAVGVAFDLVDAKTQSEVWSGVLPGNFKEGETLDTAQLSTELVKKLMSDGLLKKQAVTKTFSAPPYW